jgi:hypothetical protein
MKFFLFLLIPIFLLFPHSTFAANSGITVVPSIARLDLSTDKPEVEVFYQNTTQANLELQFSAQDFNGLEDGWKINFLQPKDATNYHYSLSSSVDFSQKSLDLAPGEQGKITVLVNKEKLTPGGHYTSILASVTQVDRQNNIGLHQILSSLLFVRTSTGKEIELARVNSLLPERDWFGFPQKYLLRIENSGNTDLTPFGKVTIKDPFGKQIATGILNEGSFVVLPETIRRFDIPIISDQQIWMPGIYSVELNLHFGKQNQLINTHNSFFVIGILPQGLLTLIVLFILYKFLRRFRINISHKHSKNSPF